MRWSSTSGPIKWVGRRHRRWSHTPSPLPPSARGKLNPKIKKSPNKRKYTDAKTNEQKREITGVLVLRNNNRNNSSNALDNHLATCQSAVRGLPQSLGRRAAPPRRRCFHSFPSSLLPLRKIAAHEGSFESRSSSRGRRKRSEWLWETLRLRCLESHINVFHSTTVPS